MCASGDACQVAICSQAIEFDHSLQLPTSLTQKSSSNDVCAGNSNDVAGNKEDDCKDGNGNGDGNQGGGQKMVTTWAIASGRRVAGNKESDGEGSKGGGDNNKVGHGNGNNMGDGHRDEGGGQRRG